MSNLKATYSFYSESSQTQYDLNLETGAFSDSIQVMGSGTCAGWPILSGNLEVTVNGTKNTYPVPSGQTPFIYNGLWQSADLSPDGPGAPWCKGIDRLFVNFSSDSNNTLINANTDGESITVVNGSSQDIAQLKAANFPPQ
ncbi:hypothetical protein [Flavobacterium sp.]|uniref:hypothetical protein n=1 Tax=Flavobacterium sp. TaxID=239 RepID=UPI003B9A7FC4